MQKFAIMHDFPGVTMHWISWLNRNIDVYWKHKQIKNKMYSILRLTLTGIFFINRKHIGDCMTAKITIFHACLHIFHCNTDLLLQHDFVAVLLDRLSYIALHMTNLLLTI